MSAAATHVFVLSQIEGRSLSDALHKAGFEFRSLQHAVFQARGEGVVVSLYRSGKLVVQGQGAEAWQVRFLGAKEQAPAKKSSTEKSSAILPDAADSLGSDEAGKGDTFGPLVVAAVAVSSSQVEELKAAKVSDSKTIDDSRIRILAPWIEENFEVEVRCLMPSEYNQRWQDVGRNVNTLLAQLHFECLRDLQQRTEFRIAVVDRFAPSCPVTARYQKEDPEVQVVEVPRAEAHLAVAAASVIAREKFLLGLESLSGQWALDLPRGSGSPVPPALRQFLQLHGATEMRQVAKVHFKNVQKFLSQN